MLDDATLLEEWVHHRRQESFTRLVEQYERLVIAAAIRRTGNPEIARDVAQQVFAMLAAKAPLLVGRKNVAGWLYHAASHLGARALRAERRRTRAQTNAPFPTDCTGEAPAVAWDAVEDALSGLGTADREAIVLHYLKDYSYPEMASALGISEPAARKRVSRAMQSLEERLKSRGIGRSAAAALAALAAQQSTTSISAASGLAAGAIASSAAVSTPVSILMSTIATHTSTKILGGVAAITLVPLVFQWNANASIRSEIDKARAQNAAHRAPEPLHTPQLAVLRDQIAAKRTAIAAAEKKWGELVELKRMVETEVVYSMGTVESMARELAKASRLSTTIESTQEALKKARAADPNSEETKRLEATLKGTAVEAATLMPRAMALVRDVLKMERSPEKAGRFYATFLAEAVGLDDETKQKIEARMEPWVAGLQQAGLALPQRPRTLDRLQWDQERARSTKELMLSLANDFPDVSWDSLGMIFPSLLGDPKDGTNSDWLDMFLLEEDTPR